MPTLEKDCLQFEGLGGGGLGGDGGSSLESWCRSVESAMAEIFGEVEIVVP